MQPASAIVFTDLDGTLLDHDDYRFDAALPALRAIQAQAIPLILTTSKTLAETAPLSRQLGISYPVIVENGSAICFPDDQPLPFELTAHEQRDGYAIVRFGPPYARIRAFIDDLRGRQALPLRGFGDMSDDEVARLTGLSTASAHLARQRLASEPFLWDGDAGLLDEVRASAHAQGLRITRGGRFWHLMGDTSKADALRALRALYNQGCDKPLTAIALGDSENDIEMLQAADIAVIIQRHDGTHLNCHGIQQTIQTAQQGPHGWNTAMLQVLAGMRPSLTSA